MVLFRRICARKIECHFEALSSSCGERKRENPKCKFSGAHAMRGFRKRGECVRIFLLVCLALVSGQYRSRSKERVVLVPEYVAAVRDPEEGRVLVGSAFKALTRSFS